MSKYEKLSSYLRSTDIDRVTLTFENLERIGGFTLPESAYNYPAWWSNQTSPGHTQNAAWQSVGWRTAEVNLSARKVSFVRANPNRSHDPLDADGQRGVTPSAHPAGTRSSLTIAEAKAGLSAHFGVPVENVEITIKG